MGETGTPGIEGVKGEKVSQLLFLNIFANNCPVL